MALSLLIERECKGGAAECLPVYQDFDRQQTRVRAHARHAAFSAKRTVSYNVGWVEGVALQLDGVGRASRRGRVSARSVNSLGLEAQYKTSLPECLPVNQDFDGVLTGIVFAGGDRLDGMALG